MPTDSGHEASSGTSAPPNFWFPAKRYGWGWGPPRVWQGWVVLLVFFGLMFINYLVFPPAYELFRHLAFVAVLCAVFIVICWLKGEPPRWRWGNDRIEKS